eukprot:superscaffoldBa00001236_g9656
MGADGIGKLHQRQAGRKKESAGQGVSPFLLLGARVLSGMVWLDGQTPGQAQAIDTRHGPSGEPCQLLLRIHAAPATAAPSVKLIPHKMDVLTYTQIHPTQL